MLEIRESQIEDIFATQLDEVKSVLSLTESLSLIDRQRKVDSGKIDLLFLSATSLHADFGDTRTFTRIKSSCEQNRIL